MAVTAFASGTKTAEIGVEHPLPAENEGPKAAGTYTLHIDTNKMAQGDVLEIRVYQMVLTGGTRRVAYREVYADDQPTDDEIKVSVPISNELTDTDALRFSIKQVRGVGREFPWKILKYA